MSAWSVGSGTHKRSTPPEGGEAAADLAGPSTITADDAATVDKLVQWIPGEVIAAYMALVVALQANSGGTPQPTAVWWLVGAVVAAGVLTFLGGFSSNADLSGWQWVEVSARTLLSAAAFALWSLVLPGSWWQSIHDIADNAAVVAIVAGIGATAFGLFAEGIVKRIGAKV